ncbi:GDSL-type esterase/lipase family protein [Roseateles oligotrophus]|uniref:GDSL-type esterase/lipase family protein n=1 Tax=Roseateles oligotrophus TaxID=1769250 RepID=A0ABT2YDM4_9BURK|nr:GDSL-type esterase/lipase family protein [Roseateles oligotrophus]MCV2368128.1 GDSL-type esterase/lipase family protein [Roseateles oligotrophus]
MNITLIRSVLAVAVAVLASQALPGAAIARDFASTKPTARVEYWQQRQAAIAAQTADTASLRAVKLVFVGDSITDFWLLGDDPWIPGRMHGRRIWDESFGGARPQNLALNIGISGDRSEHLLFRILPKAQGGLGQLDAAELAPEFFVLMVGINNSYAPESPVADSVFDGVLAVMRSLHARKPGTKLLLQSILPTSEPARDDTVVRPVNARLAALAKSPEFAGFTTWLDLYPAFVDAQGKQDAQLFVDGLHPSEAGYRIWRDRLLPVLASVRASAR